MKSVDSFDLTNGDSLYYKQQKRCECCYKIKTRSNFMLSTVDPSGEKRKTMRGVCNSCRGTIKKPPGSTAWKSGDDVCRPAIIDLMESYSED